MEFYLISGSNNFSVVTDKDFVSATAKKIKSFGLLPVGWHYGEGGPLSDVVINKAQEIDHLYRQLGLTVTDAFPGTDGALMITAYLGDQCIETIISADLRYSVMHEHDQTEILVEDNISESDAKRKIKKIGADIWSLFGLSTVSTTTRGESGSQASRSRTRKEAEFLSSRATVWRPQSEQFVNTSGPTIPVESLENPQFIGSSRNQYFLTETA